MKIKLLGILFLSFYILGLFFPNTWWTTHFLAFLPLPSQILFLSLGSIFILLPFFKIDITDKVSTFFKIFKSTHWILAMAMIGAILMYRMPIVVDYYGDAYKFKDQFDQLVPTIPNGTAKAFFKYGLSPWDGHATVLALITYIAYYANTTYQHAFMLLDALCGGLYVFFWLRFIQKYFKQTISKILFGVLGLTASFMLIFFGHMESYAPSFLCLLLLPIGILSYLKSGSKNTLFTLCLLFLLSIKLHTISLLYTPALFLLFKHHFSASSKNIHHSISWLGISKWMLTPIFLAGLFLYFLVLKDHVDPRDLNSTSTAFERLFLPLFSPEAPLDKYNLFSLNHIFDYFAEILLWSPVALFIFLNILIYKKNPIQWDKPEVNLLGSSLILFVSLFFAINPLLSMQMDWDMMAIPAPLFLVFTAILYRQIEDENWSNELFAPSIGLVILSLPIFLVHGDKGALSLRLESVGTRMYHTYYEWADKVLEYAWEMSDTPQEYALRKNKKIQELAPYALTEVDFTYARLLATEGRYFLRQQNNPQKALEYLNKGYQHFPLLDNGLLYLVEAHFRLKEFDQAYSYALQLIDIQYPSEQKAARIALQCALEAGYELAAKNISTAYIKKWNGSPVVQRVYEGLTQNTATLDELKKLFDQG